MSEEKLETKQCTKCKENIPKDAKRCKHCGAHAVSWFERHRVITIIFVIFIFLIIKGLVSSNNPNSNGGNGGINSINLDPEFLEKQKVLYEKLSEIQIVSSTIENDIIGTPILKITVKNNSKNTIDALDFEAWLYNNYDEQIGEWNRKTN